MQRKGVVQRLEKLSKKSRVFRLSFLPDDNLLYYVLQKLWVLPRPLIQYEENGAGSYFQEVRGFKRLLSIT